jgi:hypothetical protein
VNTSQKAFSAGELAPGMYARTDLERYQIGLVTARNGVVLPTGGFQSRAGTEHRVSTKANGVARIEPIEFDVGEGYILEFGEGYVRFVLNGDPVGVGTAGGWATATVYAAGTVVTHGSTHAYICIDAHTSGASTEPGVGGSWEDVWHDMGDVADAVMELPTPFTLAMLPEFQLQYVYNQITLSHPDLTGPMLLERIPNPVAAEEWTWVLSLIDFADNELLRPFEAPTGVSVDGSGGSGVGYVVTRIEISFATGQLSSTQESLPSAVVRTNIPFGADYAVATTLAAAPREISFSAAIGPSAYRVYRQSQDGGPFRLIGTYTNNNLPAGTFSLVDNGILASFSNNVFPAEGITSLSGSPAVVGAFQQRQIFAATDDKPDVAWASRVGLPLDFTHSDPFEDDDSFTCRQVGKWLQRIFHIFENGRVLFLFTWRGEYIVRGDTDSILRPGEVNPEQISANGSARYPAPLAVDKSAIYVVAGGSMVRDLYPFEAQGFGGTNLSLLSSHLLRGYTIVDWCYQQNPNSVIWIVRSDGAVLSCTYERELGILGWARHDTDGVVESCACVRENGRDAVYLVVRREINESTVRYIERMTDRLAVAPILMDCAIVYSGAPATVITGLGVLEGKAVSIVTVANGVATVIASPNNPEYGDPVVVTDGEITLEVAASLVYVGLPITTDLKTLDIDTSSGPSLRTGRFVINALGMFVEETGGAYAGQKAISSSNGLSEDGYNLQPLEILDSEGNALSGVLTGYRDVNIEGAYSDSGAIFIRNVDPVPLTVLALVPQGHFPEVE